MNWARVLFWIWAAGAVAWATFVGVRFRDEAEDAIQIAALAPPFVLLVIGLVLVWAFKVLRS